PIDKVNIDARIFHPGDLLGEKHSGLEALEPYVVEIARNDQKIDVLCESGIHHLFKCATRGAANLVDRGSGELGKTLKWRIQMNVSAVNELELHGPSP